MKIWLMIIFLTFASANGIAAAAQTMPAPPEASATVADNDEMKTIFVADQTDRGNNPFAGQDDPQPKALPGLEIRKNDDARDLRVRDLLNAGLLHTGTDYFRASLVFQHSGTPLGTLLAHVLADISIAKGNPAALWLSAATLDRYLNQTNQKQLFGTQFKTLPGQTKPPYSWEQSEVDPELLSDSIRAEFCVAPLSAHKKGLPGQPQGTNLFPCPAQAEMKSRTPQKSN